MTCEINRRYVAMLPKVTLAKDAGESRKVIELYRM